MMDPYRSVGLARNPFVADQAPGVAESRWLDRGLPLEPAISPRSFVQVLGPKGAGKTSHLLRWRTRVPGPYRHVGPGAGRLAPLPHGDVVYWDEADRTLVLPAALTRARLRRSMVVVGTHRDLSATAARHGFSVVTHRLGPLAAADVRQFAVRSIEAVGGSAVDFDINHGEIAARAGASLREAARLLHIEVARHVRDATVSFG